MQEKERLKKEKDEAEAKFKHALVDGRKEQVPVPKACPEAHTMMQHGPCTSHL